MKYGVPNLVQSGNKLMDVSPKSLGIFVGDTNLNKQLSQDGMLTILNSKRRRIDMGLDTGFHVVEDDIGHDHLPGPKNGLLVDSGSHANRSF